MFKLLSTFIALFLSLAALGQQYSFSFQPMGAVRGDNYIFMDGGGTIRSADFNGDGYKDLFVGGEYNYQYANLYTLIFLYDPASGNYTFYDTLRDNNGKVLTGNFVTIADVDSNGRLDYFVNQSNYGGYTTIFEQNTGNDFAYKDTVRNLAGEPLLIERKADFYDFNGDSLQDMYIANSSIISLYKNIGDTAYEKISDVSDIDLASTLSYNGVNDIDIDTVLYDTVPRIYVSLQDGYILEYRYIDSLHFKLLDTLHYYNGKYILGKSQHLISQTNADSSRQLLMFQDYKPVTRIVPTDSGYVIRDSLVATNWFTRCGPVNANYIESSMYFYDYDGDGKKDLFMADANGTLLFARNLYDGNKLYFAKPDTLRMNGQLFTLGQNYKFAIGDLDGNGVLDLFTVTSDGTLDLYEQISGLNFTYTRNVASFGEPVSITIGDLDVDGQNELNVGYNHSFNFVIINYDIATNVMNSDTVLKGIGYYPLITTADINGDGYEDLAVLDYNSSPAINIFLNDGNGNLKDVNSNSYEFAFTTLYPYGFAFYDYDGDGVADLFAQTNIGHVFYYKASMEQTTTLSGRIDNSIAIYPNPATDKVRITASDVRDVRITALDGKTVLNVKPSGNSIDISKLQPGTYLMQIRTSNNVSTVKLIKR